MANLLGMSSGNAANAPIIYSGLNVSSSMMDLPVAIFWGQVRLATNAIWYNDFQQHSVSGKGGGKGGGGKGSGQYTYTAATIVSLGEGVCDSIVRAWAAGSTTTTSTLSQLNQTFFNGSASQSPWSYLASNYPAQSLAYAYTSYLASPYMDLGSSSSIPDNAYECVRTSVLPYSHTTSQGWIDPNSHTQYTAVDVLMSDVIYDLLTNVQYGLGFASGDIGSMAQYAAYQQAQGLFFSPLLNTQEKATDVINRWAQLSNAWIYWSGTQLQFVPLGDTALSANGATYTPDDAVAYNLSINDFVGKPPLKVTRADPADCYNKTTLTITDRTLGYVSNPIEYKDQTLVDEFGLRDSSSTSADEIKDPVVGQIAAQLIGKRAAYVRNTYSFKTSYRYVRCLPGTVLTVTEPNIGINQIRVRVRTVEDDGKGNLSFLCEEFPANIGTFAASSAVSTNTPTMPNLNATAPSVNTPAIFEPPSSFTGGVAKVIIAASGGAGWGGCQVNISFDGSTYVPVGTITAPAPQGLLTGALAAFAGTNPDTTHTLAVNLTQSLTAPQPVTNADATALRTLALIAPQPTMSGGATVVPTNGELLAFGNVATTGAYTANLTYLERGQYGTAPGAHSIGDQFTLVDVLGTTGTTVEYALPLQYIGQPIYIKLVSFNVFDKGQQDISTVTEYQYTPTGAGFGTGPSGVPSQPSGLTGAPSLFGYNLLEWSANSVNDSVTSYSLYKGVGTGTALSSCALIYQGIGLVYTDAAVVTGTAYTYYLIANNSVGPSNPTAACNVTALSGSNIASGLTSLGATTTTGSTTSFTMSSGVPSGATLNVIVNGALLASSAYSVSGSVITFSPAIASGSTILTYYYTASGGGGGGGFNHGFGLK